MYKLAVKENLDKKLKKFRKKDKELLRFINMKVQNILKDPYRYKPLKKPLPDPQSCFYGEIGDTFYKLWWSAY